MRGAITTKGDAQVMPYGGGRFEVSEERGVWFIGADEKTGRERKTWLCGALRIVALTRDEHSDSWGVLLRWRDRAGIAHELAMPADMLQGDGCDMRRALARQGLDLGAGGAARHHLQIYLQAWKPDRLARCVERLGWYGDRFMLPGQQGSQDVGGGDHEMTVFQNLHAVEPAFSTSGTAKQWAATVGRLACGNSRLVFAIACAFSGALLEFAGIGNGGFHLRGASSTGKSTAQLAAASVWGDPQRYKRSWRFTTNGLEGVAALHNDGVLILDELSECPAREVGEAIYMLANGQGKGRATRLGTARQAQRWRLMLLSSGEESLGALMSHAGQQVKAGQEIRLMQVEADAGAGMGLFEQLNGCDSPGTLAKDIKHHALQHHGAVGQHWIAYLVKRCAEPGGRQRLIAEVRERMEHFAASYPQHSTNGQITRVLLCFAMLACAGELATQAGLTGWPEGEAEAAAATCFASWLDEFGDEGNREDRALLAQVHDFLGRHGASRFEDMSALDEQRVPNRAGFFRDVDGGREYLVLPEAFRRELCAGFEFKHAATVLLAAGWLRPGSSGRATRTERLPGLGDKTRCYVFTRAMWNDHAEAKRGSDDGQ